jgi:hypothetical protein
MCEDGVDKACRGLSGRREQQLRSQPAAAHAIEPQELMAETQNVDDLKPRERTSWCSNR